MPHRFGWYIVGGALLLASPGSGAGQSPARPAATASAGVQAHLLVSAEGLAERLGDRGTVVLHVGTDRAAYDRGHIPGARFLAVGEIMTERDGNVNELPPVARLDSVFESVGVSDDTRVVLYGPPLAAARAFFTLDALGHGERTALLDGGLEGWTADGRPISTDAPQVDRASFTPKPQLHRAVDAAWVHGHLRDCGTMLLDARPAAQFSGTDAGAGIERPGHIPGARNIFWEQLLVSTQTPRLKSVDQLRAMFRDAGLDGGTTLVTYCRSGMQASFAYFVARYLGYETRMYDGSFLDWSRRTDLPVER